MAKRSRLFTAGCIGCALLIASPSWAAMLEPGLGDLTINQGKGFKPVTSPSSANVGDSVMVGPGGSATLVYDDGCRVPVQAGAVVNVAPLSPCASGSYAAELPVPAAAGAPVAAPGWGWGWSDWFFGGLFVATGVAIGIGASHQSQTGPSEAHPASP
jgi:hypothetical protein